MLPQELIRKKRDKKELTAEEISFFIKGVTDKSIADCQTAALTMAIYLNGFSKNETTALTMSMRDSGDVLKWDDIDGPIVDKHSSGGVGDKISLMLAPMLASCGAFVPMISGRGLGHTGGTLDKFDSIPGYQTCPTNELFRKTVKEVGCAIIGQTGNLAPADKKIYSLRDVCATVESIPLITASILSKKLAAGLDCLIMDLKCGNGAFMSNIEDARELAKSIVNVANHAGTRTKALLTDMNQVLGTTAGNAVEMQEAVDYLKNINVDSRLHAITMDLCANLLVQAKLFHNTDEAKVQLQQNIDNGKALEIFAKMVSSLGGPTDFVENTEKYLPQSPLKLPVFANTSGYVNAMNTRNIGLSIIELKGGRINPEQKIDYSTGYSGFCQIGDYVDEQTPLAFVHAANEEDYEKAAKSLQNNIIIGEKTPLLGKNVFEVIE
ncbi:MAG: thymidine phosphorylase [Alphaproteobacteria bacterium]|nr:thymidine phosphorylase [Alphaproteobacteria bacterium]